MLRNTLKLICLSLRRLCSALGKLLHSKSGPRAILLIVLLFAIMLVVNGLNVLNSFVGRDFISSIENRDLSSFQFYTWCYVGVFAASAVAAVMFRFCEESLGLLWRHELTRHFTETYLVKRAYYRLEASGSLANPDQRIAEDVKAFATTTLSFILLIVNGTITVLSFSGVLWSISPRLFMIAVVYAICGSVLTIWVGRSLVRLNFNQFDLEADFRSSLIHVKQNAESIILSHREARFNSRIQSRLDQLVENSHRIILVNRNLGFCSNFYNYLIQIIPAILIAPLFIDQKVEFGVITQSAMAFATLLGAFSLIITQFQSISAFSAVISRLTGLSEAINDRDSERVSQIVTREQDDLLECSNLTLHSQDGGEVLVDRLEIRMMPGERWWVHAGDSSVKQALFRAFAGFWDQGEGAITRPGAELLFLLPERPYLPPGTLREVLLRTQNEATVQDEELMEVLNQLGIGGLPKRVGGLDLDRDWGGTLTVAELHLLTVARILLTRPSFAILDRPDSLLSQVQISAILEMLKARGVGVMVLSKNGVPPLPCDATLSIQVGGKWQISRKPD